MPRSRSVLNHSFAGCWWLLAHRGNSGLVQHLGRFGRPTDIGRTLLQRAPTVAGHISRPDRLCRWPDRFGEFAEPESGIASATMPILMLVNSLGPSTVFPNTD